MLKYITTAILNIKLYLIEEKKTNYFFLSNIRQISSSKQSYLWKKHAVIQPYIIYR